MCKNNGWIYLIVYFIMFPLGFQGAKLLDRWLNDINEQISGMHIFYLWILVVGILAALFLLAMLLLSSAAGYDLPGMSMAFECCLQHFI